LLSFNFFSLSPPLFLFVVCDKVPSDDDSSSSTLTNSKGSKTWGPSMSQQRERGFLPVFRPERLHTLVKSAPNLENNKSRSSTVSTSTENIPLGNSNSAAAFCDLVTSTASSVNSHHYTNTNYHSIYYERDLTKGSNGGVVMRDGKNNNNSRKASTTSTSLIPTSTSLNQNHSTESVDYNSDDSEHAAVGCFSFVNASSHDAKKIKNRYKKLSKESDFEKPLLPNRTFPKPSSSSMSSGLKKINNDPKKKLQFQEYSNSNSPKAEFNVDLTFYKRFEQSLDALGDRDQESSEQDIIYITSKPSKNKLAMRLQKSLDAIDSIDIISDTVESERIYSKSIDDLSTGGDYQWHRGGSQFTWECFLKNGGARKNGYEARASRNDDSDTSSQEFKAGTFS
jgi:hypothetical protein